MLEHNWRYKTLEHLEKRSFGNATDAPTPMVRRCIELAKIPLSTFTVDNLRLMIGQQISLRYLIPLAIEHLRSDLFAEGDFFPGDLLKEVLSVDKRFWLVNKSYWEEINELIRGRRAELEIKKIPTLQFDSVLL